MTRTEPPEGRNHYRARRVLERDRTERERAKIVTIPNIISLIRLVVLMPLFAVAIITWRSPALGLWIAIVLGVTDYIDGYIARRFNQVTKLGQFLDPVADRISQIVVSVSMVIVGYIPIWIAAVVVIADAALGLSLAIKRQGVLPVLWIGRIRTVLLMVGLPAVLLAKAYLPGAPWAYVVALAIVAAGALLHAVADGTYVVAILRGTAARIKDSHPEERAAS